MLGDNNTVVRVMDVNRPDEDRPCDGRDRELHRYVVKFVCGCSKGDVVAAGEYFTAINVHNTSDDTIVFRKRFSVALPGERPGNVSELTRNKLGPYEALEVDCGDIHRHNRVPEGCFLKGFAIIESEVELDVIVVYTAAKHGNEVETLDVETVQPRVARRKRRTPTPPEEPEPEKPKLPDLIPVRPFPSGPPFFPSGYCASPTQLQVIVHNQGEGRAGPTTAKVEYTNEGVVELRPTRALGAGEETTLTFPIPPGCVIETCPFKITVNANPADGLTESNTANNVDTSSCGIAS